MRALGSNHRWRPAVTLVASLAGAVVFASPARGEDGASLSELVAAVTPTAPVTVVASEPVSAVDAPLAELAESLDVVEESAAQATGEGGASTPVGTSNRDTAAPAVDDTAAEAVDTAMDTAVEPASEPPAAPDATPASAPQADAPATTVRPAADTSQTAPVNVNVSVRVDSPGDGGTVTQTNVAAVVGSETGPAPEQQPAPEAATGSGDATGSCTVLSSILGLIPDTTSGENVIPGLGNIDWNCNGNLTQNNWYHAGNVPQYHPVNVNVSIRIRSPGSDGAVTQTNVALTISSLAGTIAASTGGSASPHPASPEVAIESPVSIVRLEATALVLPEPAPQEVAALVEDARLRLGATMSVVVLSPEATTLDPGAPFGVPRSGAIADPPVFAASDGPSRSFENPHVAASTRSHPSASRWTKEQRRPARPRLEPSRSVVLLDAAPAGASAAPAPGGSSGGGGLPVFLLFLPFIVAVLDLAWRVALARAMPSGYRARLLDDPG